MKKWIRRVRQKIFYSMIGLWVTIKEEKSLWAHFVISAIVVGLGFYVKLDSSKWAIMITALSLIMGFEVSNTAMEALVDMVSFQYNLKVKKIKDIAAGATLIVTLGAIIVGLIIFIPAIQGLAHVK